MGVEGVYTITLHDLKPGSLFTSSWSGELTWKAYNTNPDTNPNNLKSLKELERLGLFLVCL